MITAGKFGMGVAALSIVAAVGGGIVVGGGFVGTGETEWSHVGAPGRGEVARVASEPLPLLSTLLPKPEELGPGWRWPWTNSPWTEDEYRQQFGAKSPTLQAIMMKSQVEMMSDEEFREGMAGFAGLLRWLGSKSPFFAGASAGDRVPEAMESEVVTKEAFIASLDAVINGTLDYASNDYDTPPPDEDDLFGDSMTITLTAYSDELLERKKDEIEPTPEAVMRTISDLKHTEKKKQLARLEQAKELEQLYAEQASRGDADKERARAILKDIETLVNTKAIVHGKTLREGGRGALYWVVTDQAGERKIELMGRARRGPVVVDYSRIAEDPFVDRVAADSERVMLMMLERLEPYTR